MKKNNLKSFVFKGVKQDLLYRDHNYELWEDSADHIQYVRLCENGVKGVIKQYQKKYNLSDDIEIVTINHNKLTNHYVSGNEYDYVYQKIMNQINNDKHSIKNKKGFIFCINNNDGYIAHTIPVFVERGSDNQVMLKSPDNIISNEKNNNFDIKIDNEEIEKYANWQKDFHSCTVFAVDWLKHQLTDKSNNLHFYQSVSGDKSSYLKPKYMLYHNNKTINGKAVFKGHDYAKKIDDSHESRINTQTQNLLDSINNKKLYKVEVDPIQYNPSFEQKNSTKVKEESIHDKTLTFDRTTSLLLLLIFSSVAVGIVGLTILTGVMATIFQVLGTIGIIGGAVGVVIHDNGVKHYDNNIKEKNSNLSSQNNIEMLAEKTEKKWQGQVAKEEKQEVARYK